MKLATFTDAFIQERKYLKAVLFAVRAGAVSSAVIRSGNRVTVHNTTPPSVKNSQPGILANAIRVADHLLAELLN